MKVLVSEAHLEDIANAIRWKLGESETYRPGDMAAAIESIDSGYPEPTGTLPITANGVVNVKDYASANVNVPNSYVAEDEGKVVSSGALVAQTSRSVTENGTYDTTENNEVVVNVSGGAINLQSKTVTQNGTVTPDAGYDGLSSVVVNVQSSGGDFTKIMNQGQVSTTSAYATATFDSGIDLTTYDCLLFVMCENGIVIASGSTIYSGQSSIVFYCTGDLDYRMRLTSTTIACTNYSGAYRDLYVNVYGFNL